MQPVYEKEIRIRSEQVDMSRRLRISELFRIMEEASIAHTEALGCTRDKTLDRGLLWVITRQTAEIDDMPFYDEDITIRSWQGPLMHVIFPRFYEILRGGECIIRGKAMWVLIDSDTREIISPDEYDIDIPGAPGSEEIFLRSVMMPSDADPADISCQDLCVRYSQADINAHMNNARYFDVIDDLLWSGSSLRVPRRINANYISELRAGDRYTLRASRRNMQSADEPSAGAMSLFFEGTSDGSVKFRIQYDY